MARLPASGVEVQRRESGRHRERREQLEVLDVGDAVRIEAVRETADERGIVPPGQRERQAVSGDRAQRKRREQRDGGRLVAPDARRRRAQAQGQSLSQVDVDAPRSGVGLRRYPGPADLLLRQQVGDRLIG